MLEIPYTNAKVIYRVFREQGRITAKSKSHHKREEQ
jgi:hypothetical protein